MPKLTNAKMEQFAANLARGMKQGMAYAQAGYAPNAGAASRMAQSPQIVDRVAEIKDEINSKLHDLMLPDAGGDILETAGSLAEMGIDMLWIADAYKKIYEDAHKNGSYAAANSAVANIQKLVEIEQGGGTKQREDDGEDRIKVTDALALVHAMGNVARAAAGLPQIEASTDPDAIPMLPDFEDFDVVELPEEDAADT
jgi:hypothetical protein